MPLSNSLASMEQQKRKQFNLGVLHFLSDFFLRCSSNPSRQVDDFTFSSWKPSNLWTLTFGHHFNQSLFEVTLPSNLSNIDIWTSFQPVPRTHTPYIHTYNHTYLTHLSSIYPSNLFIYLTLTPFNTLTLILFNLTCQKEGLLHHRAEPTRRVLGFFN